MVHLLGAALVAGGCGYLGFQAAEGLRRREGSLRQMARALGLLERELELRAPPLSQLLEEAAGRSEGAARVLLEECCRGLGALDREDFSALWRRQVAQRKEFGAEGQAVLAPLGDILGRYEARTQGESVAAAGRALGELADLIREERRHRGRVYQALGLSGGAFLVILLL